MDMADIFPQSNDGNSGESDFEIVCNSDSDTEGGSTYRKLGCSDFYCNNSSLQHLTEDYGNSDHVTAANKTGKINLNLSEDKISLSPQVKNKVVEKSSNVNFSGNFVPKFSINSISSVSNGDSELRAKKTSNLPEIVLTPYEMEAAGKMLQNSPLIAISPELKSNCNQNTSSQESHLDRNLSTSIESSSCRRGFNEPTYSQEVYSTKKPLNLSESLPFPMPVGLNQSSSPALNSDIGLNRYVLAQSKGLIPDNFKCKMCGHIFADPRTLNCLHSFCYQCLVNENFGKDESIPFWSGPDGNQFEWKVNISTKSSSTGDSDYQRPESRSSSSSFKSKKSTDRKSKDKSSKSSPKHSTAGQPAEKTRILVCATCQYCTEMPMGGIRQLPQNLILVRRVEKLLLKVGSDVIANAWCSLCCAEIPATYHCITCMMNLCGFCKEAHERQKTTTSHNVKNILDLQRSRNSAKKNFEESQIIIKCSLHPGFDLKFFCTVCQQVICTDCSILIHKGHKMETIHKSFKVYNKLLKESSEKSRPLCEYVEHSILKLGGITKRINQKCDEVQQEVEQYMAAYFEALEVHRRTLIQQVARARETKMQIILEQQLEMEKRSKQNKEAMGFVEDLLHMGNESEVLSFASLLLKRFEYCQKFKAPIDAKISDALHFLPEIRAPSTKAQNNIPLFGIITTQTVEPQYCTLETEGFAHLRVHRKVELMIVSRDGDGAELCHGGLDVNVQIKYKDISSKKVDALVSDRRDGTYLITFLPDSAGTLVMAITINNRHIKGSPFHLHARTVRPHNGIFHCCTFCSSKGSKTATCACEGVMPGFKGCGHGHSGHPGRRHWSCCGSVLENSECSTANSF